MIFIWFFQYLFNDQIIELMNCESNKYSVHQNPAKPLKFKNSELEQFPGILFTMSVAKMPSVRSYCDQSVKYLESAIPLLTAYHPKVKELGKLIRDLLPLL